jgi:hypothetical protein
MRIAMRIAGLLLLLLMTSIALYADQATPSRVAAPTALGVASVAPIAVPGLEPACSQDFAVETSPATTAPLSPVVLDRVEIEPGPGCNCDLQCGGCGRLRGCFNGWPICECIRC